MALVIKWFVTAYFFFYIYELIREDRGHNRNIKISKVCPQPLPKENEPLLAFYV